MNADTVPPSTETKEARAERIERVAARLTVEIENEELRKQNEQLRAAIIKVLDKLGNADGGYAHMPVSFVTMLRELTK